MIEVRGLSVELGGRDVVDGVDLSVADGEWVTVIGPNGAGKTTLLRALAGLAAARGTIEVGGRAISAALAARPREARRVRPAAALRCRPR